nr:hypothetical protein [uncultured Bacillus sp.]
MKKIRYILILAVIALWFLLSEMNVSATSWVVLEPEKVEARADVIIKGTYDFSSEPVLSDFVFQGLDFHVDTVYKGDAREEMTAGIDGFDIGWAQEFQNKGGEFLLFLEKTEDTDFLIPVGGPNGMVQMFDRQVADPNEDRRAYFINFLKREKSALPSKENDSQGTHSGLLLVATACLAVLIGVFIWIYRNWEKNSRAKGSERSDVHQHQRNEVFNRGTLFRKHRRTGR